MQVATRWGKQFQHRLTVRQDGTFEMHMDDTTNNLSTTMQGEGGKVQSVTVNAKLDKIEASLDASQILDKSTRRMRTFISYRDEKIDVVCNAEKEGTQTKYGVEGKLKLEKDTEVGLSYHKIQIKRPYSRRDEEYSAWLRKSLQIKPDLRFFLHFEIGNKDMLNLPIERDKTGITGKVWWNPERRSAGIGLNWGISF